MINYVNFDLFYKNSVPKETTITYSGGTITNTDLYLDGMSLIEGINSSEQLQFGNAEAAEFRMKIASANLTVPSLVGEELDVSMVLDGDTANPFHFGKYTVVSDTPDRLGYYREVVAYDALYDVFSKDFGAWYNAQTFPMTLKQFRDGFFAQAGITQEIATLANDGMTVTKTISPEVLTGKAIITAICEINGVFGHIGRDGKFKYVELVATHPALYPADDIYPDDTLYPADETGSPVPGARIINGDYESYYSDYISKLTIRDDDESVGVTVGSGANEYTVTNNFLLYGMSTANLTTVATNMFNVIKNAYYRPAELTVVGNPCFEVGDAYNANCNGEMVRSYILERKITGTQFLEDTYTAEGHDAIEPNSNSLMAQIERLNGASHKMIVDDAKFYSELFDSQGNSVISQLSDEIQLYVKKGTSYNGMVINSNGIKCTGNGSFQVAMSNLGIDGAGNVEIKGKVTATSGYIGTVANGFSIDASSISNGMTSLSDTTHDGVYVGTNGIALGKGKFKVTSAGSLTATSGTIAGFNIGTDTFSYGNNTIINASTDQSQNTHLKVGDDAFNETNIHGVQLTLTGANFYFRPSDQINCYGDISMNGYNLTEIGMLGGLPNQAISVPGELSVTNLLVPSLGTITFQGRSVGWEQITYLDANGQPQTKYFLIGT